MANQRRTPREQVPQLQRSGSLAGRTILVLPYTHLDWAWCFSREWHHARYAAIFDEALRLADQDPGFCLFIDSLAESLEPYLAARPQAREAWDALVAAGRVAVVGGQYVNLRPSTAPEEMFVRNLVVGRGVLRRLLPTARPTGYANLDTAIGHSQLPQVLLLAGLNYMMVGRSENGLQEDGIPAVFRWGAPTGQAILVLVQHYGVCTGPLQRLDHAEAEVRAKAAAELQDRLGAQAAVPVDTVYAILGADDTRYLHDALSDRPYDLARILHDWNAQQPSRMRLATPDDLVRRLSSQMARLELRRGTVDQGDVGYNGPFGQSGLRESRDRTAAALVEAEVYVSLAGAGHRRRDPLAGAWRQALRAQAHATQYLFSADVDALRSGLVEAVQTADRVRTRAMDSLAPRCLPQDSALRALFNPLPQPRVGIVAIPVLRTDFAVSRWTVTDADGRPVPQQELPPPNVHRPGEWDLLVETTVPAAGYATLRLHPDHSPRPRPQQPAPLPPTGVVTAGPCRLAWEDGLLARLETDQGVLAATADTSLLEPLCRPVKVRGWLTTAVEAPPARVTVTGLRQTEWGPLRWCFERTATVGAHRLRQWFRITAGGRLEVTTDVAYGPADCLFSLAMPCEPVPVLSASVPFGVEPRRAASTPAVAASVSPPIERLIPGMFYARDWVQKEGPGTRFALVVISGDRYWLCRGWERRLEHLLLRSTEPGPDGWEQFTQMNRPGYMRFHHVLVIGPASTLDRLTSLADEGRFPVRVHPVRQECPPRLSRARLEPAHVRLLSWRQIGTETEIRLVESAGQATPAVLTLCGQVQRARLVDLQGKRLADRLTVAGSPAGSELLIGMLPWQIRTVRCRWTPAPDVAEISPR